MTDNSTAAIAAEQRAKAVLRNEVVTVRYQIADIPRAIEFYTKQLGFTLEMASGNRSSGARGAALRSARCGRIRRTRTRGTLCSRPIP